MDACAAAVAGASAIAPSAIAPRAHFFALPCREIAFKAALTLHEDLPDPKVAVPADATCDGARVACAAPRGYPYGVGTGEVLEWGVAQRPLLLLEDTGPRPTPAEFHRRRCR